jgi:hypothetical protein
LPHRYSEWIITRNLDRNRKMSEDDPAGLSIMCLEMRGNEVRRSLHIVV